MYKTLAITTTLIGVAALAGSAQAQMAETSAVTQSHEMAPRNAVELTLGAGYTQGLGQIQKGGANNINDVANGGIGLDLGIGYRFTPNLALAIDGQYQELNTANTSNTASSARGAAFGVDGTYHFMPNRRFDPWVRVGTGYRLLWSVPTAGRNVLFHGFDLVRGSVGVDIKNTADFAIGPMVGADLNTFLWQRPDGGTNTTISDPRVNTFVYAGVQGRWDMGGTRETAGGQTVVAKNDTFFSF
jgi:hypothetical protein